MWQFIKSASDKNSWFCSNEVQLCFWGRSNVGKSSLLNSLTGQKISYVSKTPGRTQLVNFFKDNNDKIIVDLPGYGFANMSKSANLKMINNIKSFLQDKTSPKHILLLIDSRTGLTKIDVEYLTYLNSLIWPIALVFTKIDKLKQSEKVKLSKQIDLYQKEAYFEKVEQIFFASAQKKLNMDELINYISSVLYKDK